MSTRKIKKQVLALLAETDLTSVLSSLNELPTKDVINSLFSGICRSDELVRWHAVSCMGQMVDRLAQEDFEEARIIMRRLLWSLNDESGGIGWGAPETMAEIMSFNEQLAEEYSHMLLSYMREDGEEPWQDGNYLEHETLQQGLLWGAGRLAVTRKQLMQDKGMVDDLLPYLEAEDGHVRGLAVRAIGLLGVPKRLDQLRLLLDDPHVVRLYKNNAIVAVTVGELADKALQRLAD